jgi:hypothetical protein
MASGQAGRLSAGQLRIEWRAILLHFYGDEPIQSLQIRGENFYLRLEALDRTDVPPPPPLYEHPRTDVPLTTATVGSVA